MLNTRSLGESKNWHWLILTLATGLIIASLPLTVSILLITTAIFITLMLIEPVLALVVMLSLAPLKTLIETESTLTLPLDIGQLSFFLAVGIWLIHKISLRQRFLYPQNIPILRPIGLFFFATALTLPTAYSVSAGINEWVKWAEILLLIYIVADYGKSRRDWLVLGLVIAAVSQALIGLYEFRGGSGAAHLWILDFRFFRAFGSFGQPNPFGAFMGLVLPLALGAAWGYLNEAWHKRRHSTWHTDAILCLFYSLSALILLLGLLVSWSRGAWLGFGVVGMVLLWLAPPRLWQGTLLLIAASILIGILWFTGRIPPQIAQRITDFQQDFTGFQDVRGVVISDENYAVVERLAHWQSALDMAKSHPWLGVGFGNYEIAYPDFALINWPLALGHAHNYYLNLVAETGLIGLAAYLLMWIGVLWMTWRLLRQTQGIQRGLALGLMGAWIQISVHSLVDKLYVNNLFLHLGVMFGLLAILQTSGQQNSRINLWSKPPTIHPPQAPPPTS